MSYKLSILICTMDSREDYFNKIFKQLDDQIENYREVQIVIERDNGYLSVGQKRNMLLKRAQGEYLCFVDDDDELAENYVSSILNAIKSKPDYVVISLNYYEDGKFRGVAHHSMRYDVWHNEKFDDGSRFYQRTPNHLNPIKSSIAKLVKFPEIDFGEDREWSEGVYPMLKTEAEIIDPIYNYMYRKDK